MRLRATQIAAVAAALLGLVQIGRMITGESVTAPRERERTSGNNLLRNRHRFHPHAQLKSGALAKSGEVAAGRPQGLALKEPPPPAPAQSKDEGACAC